MRVLSVVETLTPCHTCGKEWLPAPGLRVHLAYLYIQQSELDRAKELLMEERRDFPESTHLVDRMLSRLKGI